MLVLRLQRGPHQCLGLLRRKNPGGVPDVALPTFQGPPAPRPAHLYVSVSVDFPRSPEGQQVASHQPSMRQMTCPRSGSEQGVGWGGSGAPRPGSIPSPLCREAPPSWAHLEMLLQETPCHQNPGPVPNPWPQGSHSSSSPGPRPPLPGVSGFPGAQGHSPFQSVRHHPLNAPCHPPGILTTSPALALSPQLYRHTD